MAHHRGRAHVPLYLIHLNIGMTLIHHFRNRVSAPVLVLSVTALMLVAAWLIHRFVERPVGKWLRTVMRKGVEDARRHMTPRRKPVRQPEMPPVRISIPDDPRGVGSPARDEVERTITSSR